MSHPDLESARVKLSRAQEHIERLKTEQDGWAKTQPKPFDTGLKDDVQPDRILGYVSRLDDPPGFMSSILGDVIHNLRSTLDHITWQLVQHGRRPNLKRREAKQVQFPIYGTLAEFDANLSRRIPGVLDIHEAIVRRYQPYQRGALAADHPFAVLQDLSDTDKHRNIHLTYWCASHATFEVTKRPIGCLVSDIVALLDLNDPLKVNAPLFQVVVAGDRTLCRGMEVDSHFTYAIAFDDGTWVHNKVSYVERLASDLLAEIDRVL